MSHAKREKDAEWENKAKKIVIWLMPQTEEANYVLQNQILCEDDTQANSHPSNLYLPKLFPINLHKKQNIPENKNTNFRKLLQK